ncbi:MAG: OFA family MFS transporter [Pseudomonadota bacterium]
MSQEVKNKGWAVTFGGTGINLALGILYAWSIFKGAIEKSVKAGGEGAFTWDLSQLNDPYSVCCLVFAFAMILAGKCQDKFGPKITAFMGGIMVGLGLLWISQSTSYISWVLGFGVLAGTGIGFGYSSATPPALKWFPPAKTGLIAGLVVSGFGLAPVYIAPLSEYLLKTYGIQTSMMIYGISFMFVVCGLSTLLINPPAGYVPGGALAKQKGKALAAQNDLSPAQIIKTREFWMLWTIYFIGAGAGLMVIGSVTGMAKKSMGDAAFIAVAIMAIGNAAGRILTGVASDKFGRNATLAGVLVFQAMLMLAAIPLVSSTDTSAFLIVMLATFIGFNYGSNLSLFPSFAKDRWGLKSFGINYGILFTAWGVGGFVMSRVQQTLMAATGSFTTSLIIAAILLSAGTVLTLMLKEPKTAAVPEGVIFQPQLGLTMADGGEKIEKDVKKK